MNGNLTPQNNHPLANADYESTDGGRAIREVETAIVMAHRFPRNLEAVKAEVLAECSMMEIAQEALYIYPKGGQMVDGPSIRLAEVFAANMNHFQAGLREIQSSPDETELEAFAWDVQKGSRASKIITVPHFRTAYGKRKRITDPREIYEHVHNQGARRLRACILSLVPASIKFPAIEACNQTILNSIDDIEAATRDIIEAFDGFGVDQAALAGFLGHNLTNVSGFEILKLRKAYTAIKDGTKPQVFFKSLRSQPQHGRGNDALNS